MAKFVYFFGNGKAEGNATMKNLLGGKGANLAEMTNLGIPVPPGFTISTEACIYYYENNQKYPEGLLKETEEALKVLEKTTGKNFSDPQNPLLVSVRSGAAVSMPGMMDTILNLGLNDAVAEGLAKKTGNRRLALDAYRRLIQMFSNVVLGVEHAKFEELLVRAKKAEGAKTDVELSESGLKNLVQDYKKLLKSAGKEFPEDPRQQLQLAINAVFSSWNNERAIVYRNLYNIPHSLGTGVNVQSMVFGNMGDTSGTGVCFTRDPGTGEKRLYGEYLMNAQGEDVVAGIRTPRSIEQMKQDLPDAYKQLVQICDRLEKHYRDMQDIEFTVEDKKLFMLQCRTGMRTAQSAVRVAVEMVEEGLIDRSAAILRVKPEQLDQLLHPTINPKAKLKVIAKGLPASPGAAVGKVVFESHDAIEMAEAGGKVILVRLETSPEDVEGMAEAQGILTARGGMTSHAAVVGRGMGKCCVVGCSDIIVHEAEKEFVTDNVVIREGDWITLNGSTGEVISGETELVEPQLTGSFKTLMEWADSVRKLGVRANADTPTDAKVARDFGAEGIGLCRTEHMFFAEDRILTVRKMILSAPDAKRAELEVANLKKQIAEQAEDKKLKELEQKLKEAEARLARYMPGYKKSLTELLPMQKGDFIGILKAMEDFPVTIRLLDPPLHEFLPTGEDEIKNVATELGVSTKELKDMIQNLHEFNPMLGHRGCRLGITFPEIYELQVQAIFEAACELTRTGQKIIPEVMIPLVGHIKEFEITKKSVVKIAEDVMKKYGVKLDYLVGTMIEIPRAALTADEIGRESDFFSFGTNDLTQMTFGFSRDDAGKFLPFYVKEGILEKDPFISIDQIGVGQLMRTGTQKGRGANPKLKVGICGEHGGDPSSIEFCHKIGLNYVSCSPYRVPIARLAAAQAALKEKASG